MSATPVDVEWRLRDLLDHPLRRREFIAFCGKMAALLGLGEAYVPRIAHAIESAVGRRKPAVIWLEFQDCAGNTESFTRASSPSVAQAVLDAISLDYHETLMAAAGRRAEEARERSLKENSGRIIVVVEGSVPTRDDGVYCTIAGKTAMQHLQEIEPHALVFVSVGTCSSFGGLPMASPNPTGAAAVEDVIRSKPVINLPGCPANPDVLMGLLVHYLLFNHLPDVDQQHRPLFAYGKRIHDTCERRAHFDAGQFVYSFDDSAARNGHCLYRMGCKGPETYNICAARRWNLEASWPVKAGHPCIGCSERGFWDRFTPFYDRLPHVKGFGVEAEADRIGKGMTAVAATGVIAHAIYTWSTRRSAAKVAPPPEKKESSPKSKGPQT